jgi:hypothetical protein
MLQNTNQRKNHSTDFINESVTENQNGNKKAEKWDNDVVHKLSGYVKTSEKMKLSRHWSQFKFLPLQKYVDPFSEMEKYVKYAVKETIEEGERNFGRIDRIGMEISSRMLNWNINMPISLLTANTVDAFLNRFQIDHVNYLF